MNNIHTVSTTIQIIRICVGVCSVILGLVSIFLWLGLIFNYSSYMLGYDMGSGHIFPMIIIFLSTGIAIILTSKSTGTQPTVCAVIYLIGFLMAGFFSTKPDYPQSQGIVFSLAVASLAMALTISLSTQGTWKKRMIMIAIAVVLIGLNYTIMKYRKSVYEKQQLQWQQKFDAENRRESESADETE